MPYDELIIGRKIYDWEIVGKPFVKKERFHRVVYVPCQCKCGRNQNVRANQLLNNKTTRCTACSNRKVSCANRKCTLAKDGLKKCGGRCGQFKPVCEFNRQVRQPDGYEYMCKVCKRERWIKNTYGITPEEVDVMREQQDNLCALCHKPFEGDGQSNLASAIDHDHKTKKVRGILHNRCNRLLGQANDSPELLAQAKSYLEKHQEQSAA